MKKITPIWKDEACFIVGGGPSLKNFDWKKLEGKNVIAINRAIETVPSARALYFSDIRFWGWYAHSIVKHGAEFKVTHCREAFDAAPDKLTYVHNDRRYGLASNREKICDGKNSGYAAINLAVHFGVNKITLLGYDMAESGSDTHWHSGYSEGHAARKLKAYVEAFGALKEPLHSAGVEVVNACENSVLPYWEKIALGDVAW